MGEVELAYAAGLFDGEGSIGIATAIRKYGSYHRLHVSMTNSNREVVEWFRESFGGNVQAKVVDHSRHKDTYRWTVTSAAAESFLRAVRPYLRIKAPQADLGIALRETVRTRQGSRRLDPLVLEQRHTLRLQMLALNKRGR